MMPRWQRSQKGRVCNMRYHNITKDDMLNGDGLRVVLWVAGCAHGCKECQNPVTWDPDGGLLFEEEAKKSCLSSWKKLYQRDHLQWRRSSVSGKQKRNHRAGQRNPAEISGKDPVAVHRI